MRRAGGTMVYSPTDLCRFMRSRFASWHDRLALDRPDVKRDEVPDDLALIFEKAAAAPGQS